MSPLDDIQAGRDREGQAAAQVYWWWRQYLDAKHRPAERDALLQPIDRRTLDLFNHVWSSRYVGVGHRGVEPDSIETELLQELTQQASAGFVPLGRSPDDYVRIDPIPTHDPAQPVQLERHEQLAQIRTTAERYRLPLQLGGVVLVVVVLWILVGSAGSSTTTTSAEEPAATVEAETTTAESDDGWVAWAWDVVRDRLPTIPGQREPVYPVSLEIAGTVYGVEPSQINADGEWTYSGAPRTASWLIGTFIQPVFCVEHVDGIVPNTAVRVWDSTGTIRTFAVADVRSVAPHQIEVLAQRTVGLTVLTCGGTSDRRTLVTATFHEENAR